MKKINVSVVGANGYTGQELLRILSAHPQVNLDKLVARSDAGKAVTDVFPSLSALKGYSFADIAADLSGSDLVFSCLPHATTSEFVGNLLAACHGDMTKLREQKIIDLSADFRYKDLKLYEDTYKVKHACPEILKEAVYGLCEINRKKIKKAQVVGNPGCYTSCAILSLYPLLDKKLISLENIIIDAKSGTSGAGKKAEAGFSFCEVNESFKAYGVTTHRHTSEIEEQLSFAAKKPVPVCFTPHLLPVQRGILSTIYCTPKAGITETDIAAAYKEFYAGEPFITVMPCGTFPELKYVTHTNNFMLGYILDKKNNKVIIVSALDNLMKGASGQAVQNMNIMFGLPETEGLL